jgi:2,3,4,5-tetrahydropyridine-2-carboxylate N-succinyltransferase
MSDKTALAKIIDDAFEARDGISTSTRGEVRDAVEEALNLLDRGQARVAEKGADGNWTVNQWLKKAVLLSFRLNDDGRIIKGGPGDAVWWDKVASKFDGWGGVDFEKAGFRAVPNCIVRRSALSAERRADAVLRQSRRLCRRRHHGRYLGDGRLLRPDRQERPPLGRRRHRRRARAAAGQPGDHRGQLLHRRPLRGRRRRASSARARCSRMGVFISASTKIVDRATGEVHIGEVPPYSVVVQAPCRASPAATATGAALYCAVIVKTRRRADPLQDRASTSCCATER